MPGPKLPKPRDTPDMKSIRHPSPPRVELQRPRTGVPNLLLFGRYAHTKAHPGLDTHAHAAAIEICYLVKGRQTYRVGRRDYVLRGGDVFLTFPNEAHSTGSNPQEKGVLYWLILRIPRARAPFLGLPPALARPLVRALLQLRHGNRHFRGDWDMKADLDAALAAGMAPATPLRATHIANRVVAFLLRLLACAHAAPSPPVDHRLRDVVLFIEQNLAEPLTIRDLASRTGLSLSRFKTRFKEETGVPPMEYILRARIAAARQRLTRGKTTVTDTAYALGFSSSQYFATVFKRFTGERPSTHRRPRST